jgi:hypothetical protein
MKLVEPIKRLFSIESIPPVDRPEKYLFIICMNNSGSTLLERILRDCRNAVGFPAGPDQQVNGQQFVQGYMPIPGRMKPKCTRIWTEQAAVIEDASRYDWPKINHRWRVEWARNPKMATANPRVFLEKSPANVLRAPMLQRHFKNSFFVLIQRNPYAVAEGIRRRMGFSIDRCIVHWIRCAQKQMQNETILPRAIRLSYEQLSEEPEICRQQIVHMVPELDDLDMNKQVAVHSVEGRKRQSVVNYNEKQIALLSKEDLAEINRHLEKVPEVMSHFRYEYIHGRISNQLAGHLHSGR